MGAAGFCPARHAPIFDILYLRMIHHRYIPLSLALLSLAALLPAARAAANTDFHPGELWLDTEGNVIDAHGGGMLYADKTYYWFGEARGGPQDRVTKGVSCYSSKDLLNWKNEGIVLPVVDDPNSPIARGAIIERPKVVYNRKTRQYVMWFHNELRGRGYTAAQTGVAVSGKPTGPYRFLDSFRPDGQESRDMTVFEDTNGKAYIFYASENNRTMHVSQLTDDYLKTTGNYQRIFVGRCMEAPAVFKYKKKYYFTGSDCTGWRPNPQRSAVADSPLGPWTELGNPCVGPGADLTFQSQTNYVLPVAGKKNAFIWMGDRWHPQNQLDSRYVWLPIRFSTDHRLIIPWMDRWNLSYFH